MNARKLLMRRISENICSAREEKRRCTIRRQIGNEIVEKRARIHREGREEVDALSEKQDEAQFVLVFILQRKCLIKN